MFKFKDNPANQNKTEISGNQQNGNQGVANYVRATKDNVID
jgi:hypothetical protein